jgi:hypothetical protein
MKAQLMYAAAIIVVLIGAGTTNPVVTQSSTITPTTNVLVPGVNRTVDAGGVWGIGGSSFQFNKGDQISGTAQVSNMDPSKGNLFFYVMDTPQWVAFGQGKPCNLCARRPGDPEPGICYLVTIVLGSNLSVNESYVSPFFSPVFLL